MQLTSRLFAVRTLIMFAVAAFCLSFSKSFVMNVMIILGQAHFSMAYLYQYKAGKVDRQYVIKYVCLFIGLFGGFSLFGWERTLGFVAGTYFVLHFLYDERFLLAEKSDFYGWMRLMPVLVIFAARSLYDWYQIDLLSYAAALATSGFIVWAGNLVRNRRRPNYQDISFVLVFMLGMVFVYGEPIVGPSAQRNTLSFIIITHYMNWYFHYLVRFSDKPQILKTLVRDIVLINGALFILFLGYHYFDGAAADYGRFIFEPSFFYLWTLMHYMVTFRPTDLRNWVPASSRV